ncbi:MULTISPECIES: AAA family ATPase [unclassified Ruegeria]|uniref:AAA family ATPase n=1 Tax=unclassified Ruegeria TaxID=2625375 RepID=UPI001487C63D|nr:AAA family ATPase [Ruegeria sp. HKCCD7318]
MSKRRIVLSGCSGGGKSTLLQEMARRGYATVIESGRRVVIAEQQVGGTALPWSNTEAFCRKVIETAFNDMTQAPDGLVLFDRSALDALIWFERTDTDLDKALKDRIVRLDYDRQIFLFPPWPEIYVKDSQRKHDLFDALAEYEGLCDRLPKLGFKTTLVPKRPVEERADWLEAQLDEGNKT